MPQLDFSGADSKISADKIQGQSGTTVTVPTGHKIVATDATGIEMAGTAVKAGDWSVATQVAPSTSGNVLTSTGSAWASSAPAGGGAWNYIASGTASTSSSVDFESSITSTYDVYAVTWTGVTMSADNIELKMRFGTGGTPTYQTSSYYYLVEKMSSFNNATNMQSENGADDLQLTGNVRSTGTGANSCGIVRIYNPSSTSLSTVYDSYGTGTHGGSYTKTHQASGHWQSTTAVTAFRFMPYSGTMTTGTFRLYGISNS